MTPSQYEVDTSGTNVFQVTVKNLRSSSLDLDLRIDISNQILTAWIGAVPQSIDGDSEWNGELMITAKDNIDVGNYPLEVSIYRDGNWIDSAFSNGILVVKSDTVEINLTPGGYFELSMDIFNPMSSGTTITVTAETPSGISVLYNNMPTYSEYVEGEGIRTVTVKITVDNVGAPTGNNEIEIKANGGSFAGMATVNVILPGGEEEGDEESMMMTIAIAVGVILIIGLAAYFYRRDDDEYEYYDDDEEYEEEW